MKNHSDESMNLYVLFKFYGSDGSEFDHQQSRTHRLAVQNLEYEFVETFAAGIDSLPENDDNPYTIVCVLYQDSTDSLQDYTGGTHSGSIENWRLTVSDTPVKARRLINREQLTAPGTGTHFSTLTASISQPTSSPSRRYLTVVIEAPDDIVYRSGADYIAHLTNGTLAGAKLSALNINVPETVWVDYEGIEKYVATFDGIYRHYDSEWEESVHDKSNVADLLQDVILSAIPKIGAIINATITLSEFYEAIAARGVTSMPNSENCSDNVTVTTILPDGITAADSGTIPLLNGSLAVRRLKIVVPIISLSDDDYISLKASAETTNFNPDNARPIIYEGSIERNDLLKSGQVPSCEPHSGTSP